MTRALQGVKWTDLASRLDALMYGRGLVCCMKAQGSGYQVLGGKEEGKGKMVETGHLWGTRLPLFVWQAD